MGATGSLCPAPDSPLCPGQKNKPHRQRLSTGHSDRTPYEAVRPGYTALLGAAPAQGPRGNEVGARWGL